jgi:hypothetical protein
MRRPGSPIYNCIQPHFSSPRRISPVATDPDDPVISMRSLSRFDIAARATDKFFNGDFLDLPHRIHFAAGAFDPGRRGLLRTFGFLFFGFGHSVAFPGLRFPQPLVSFCFGCPAFASLQTLQIRLWGPFDWKSFPQRRHLRTLSVVVTCGEFSGRRAIALPYYGADIVGLNVIYKIAERDNDIPKDLGGGV